MKKKYHIGYTCGVFDLFHIGHLSLLERCKDMCDILIVGVCSDEYVLKIKKKIPIIKEKERLKIISALKFVDEAFLIDIDMTLNKKEALNKFKFDVLFSGEDWKDTERYKKIELEFSEYNVNIEYIKFTYEISSTSIKNLIINQTNAIL